MNEPYFVIITYSSMSSPMSEQPQDWRNAASQRPASIREKLLLETMTALVVPASGEACTTKVQFPANYPRVQFFRFAIATSLFVDRDFDWRTARRGVRVDD